LKPERTVKRIEWDLIRLCGLLQVMAEKMTPKQRVTFQPELEQLFQHLRERIPYMKQSLGELERLLETYERSKGA